MSRTRKDAPGARRGRLERRFADRETPLGQPPATAAPPAYSGRASRAAVRIDSEVFERAELTAIANGF